MESAERFGKYEVVDRIGTGGFGDVFRGFDPVIKRDVAIKICVVSDESLRTRFLREAEIAGNLHHQNLTTIYDFGFEDEVPYIVQELLSGEDLQEIIRRGEQLPMGLKIDYLLQVAHGLQHAHSKGVVHRDLKPGNVRILDDGRAKIMDFGIAKLMHSESNLTRTGTTVGTAAYLAPEQIRGEPVDLRTDAFSFGVLAYELLTGERPFKGDSFSAVLFQIISEEPMPVRESCPECPEAVADLVERCMAKDPEDRFSSFAEVVAILDDQPSSPGPSDDDRHEVISPPKVQDHVDEKWEPATGALDLPTPKPARGARLLAVLGTLVVVAILVFTLGYEALDPASRDLEIPISDDRGFDLGLPNSYLLAGLVAFALGGWVVYRILRTDTSRRAEPLAASQVAESQPPDDVVREETSEMALPADATVIRSLADIAPQLELLNALGTELLDAETVDDVLMQVMETAFDALPIDRGLFLLGDSADSLECVLMREADSVETSPAGDIPVSKTILQSVMEDRVAMFTVDAQADQRFSAGESVLMADIRAALCAPLWSDETIKGFFQVDGPVAVDGLNEQHLDLLVALANYAAVALDRVPEEAMAASTAEAAATLPIHTSGVPEELAVALTPVRCPDPSLIGRRTRVDRFPFRIGRGQDCELPIAGDPGLSRTHCELHTDGISFQVRDCDSTNGTLLNGRRLSSEPAQLFFGDSVSLSNDTMLTFIADGILTLPDLEGVLIDERYRLRERIHQSLKASTYDADDEKLPRKVAIKMFSPYLAGLRQYQEEFWRQAEAASQLTHPSICRVIDCRDTEIEIEGHPRPVRYLCMELMEGGNFATRLSEGEAPSVDETRGWIRVIGLGLVYSHASGVVHGGLSPTAIVFDRDGKPKITDFASTGRVGVAPSGDTSRAAYLAKEQWAGSPPEEATDQYALAVLAYEALSGSVPYEGQGDPDVRRRNFRRVPAPAHEEAAHEGRETFPAAVSQVLERALRSEPADRYSSVQEFVESLDAAFADKGRKGAKVFISYHREASSVLALHLRSVLVEKGISCFLDTRMTDSGPFPETIRNAIAECEVFVCLLADSTLDSDWVCREILAADELEKQMVPVFQESYREPAELEPHIHALLHHQGVHLPDQGSPVLEAMIDHLTRRIEETVDAGDARG